MQCHNMPLLCTDYFELRAHGGQQIQGESFEGPFFFSGTDSSKETSVVIDYPTFPEFHEPESNSWEWTLDVDWVPKLTTDCF